MDLDLVLVLVGRRAEGKRAGVGKGGGEGGGGGRVGGGDRNRVAARPRGVGV